MRDEPAPGEEASEGISSERLAYWYFRLNGFLQIENFIVHPENRGSQRTDADLLGVRFRHRVERAFDGGKTMEDDAILQLNSRFDDVVIVEVKTNQPCALNGPWTNPKGQNVHRVLAAIGCLNRANISDAATCIYESGVAIYGHVRIRLVAVGRHASPLITERHPGVLQLTWPQISGFIWDRFRAFRNPKRQVQQWGDDGQLLKRLSEQLNREEFIARVCSSLRAT